LAEGNFPTRTNKTKKDITAHARKGSPAMRIICPHCGAPATIRKSAQLSKTCRETRCTCTNDECGCVFVATITPTRILSPSAIPAADVFIPLSSHINPERIAAELAKRVPRVS
jgi:hypothetical protein